MLCTMPNSPRDPSAAAKAWGLVFRDKERLDDQDLVAAVKRALEELEFFPAVSKILDFAAENRAGRMKTIGLMLDPGSPGVAPTLALIEVPKDATPEQCEFALQLERQRRGIKELSNEVKALPITIEAPNWTKVAQRMKETPEERAARVEANKTLLESTRKAK